MDKEIRPDNSANLDPPGRFPTDRATFTNQSMNISFNSLIFNWLIFYFLYSSHLKFCFLVSKTLKDKGRNCIRGHMAYGVRPLRLFDHLPLDQNPLPKTVTHWKIRGKIGILKDFQKFASIKRIICQFLIKNLAKNDHFWHIYLKVSLKLHN